MQYMILIYGAEANWSALTPEQIQEAYSGYVKYSADLGAAGVLRGGAELKPVSTATSVRVRDGKMLTTDGPFAETKEQLGGYYIIDVPHLDDAIQWAAKCPGALHGTVEVRPLGMGADGASN